MIYHSGYLIIKGYEEFVNLFLIDFLNNEIKNVFIIMITKSYIV